MAVLLYQQNIGELEKQRLSKVMFILFLEACYIQTCLLQHGELCDMFQIYLQILKTINIL